MPLYAYICPKCGKALDDVYAPLSTTPPPVCCDAPMERRYGGNLLIKEYSALWIDRMDDIHKAQEQRGERLRIVHPREVMR